MSAATRTAGGSSTPAPARRRRRLSLSGRNALLLSLGILLVLSMTRALTGANDVTSSGAFGAALAAAVPIGLAGLGGLWAERAGVVNIGLEGMMVLGTWGAGWAGYQWGPWAGILAGIVLGAVGGLVHAIATVTFGVDHIISGVAINILGPGVTKFLSVVLFTGEPGGGGTQSPPVDKPGTIGLPGLGSPLKSLEDRHWFLVSDVAALLRGVLVDVSLVTVLAVLLVVATYVILWRTAFGLRLRSCGEHPQAAESLGVNVYRYKYIAVIVSGGLAGLGGAFLAIVASFQYRQGQTGGRGFIGLATMIFGNWRPGGLAAGAGLFGYTDALQLRGGEAVHALLLPVGIGLILLAGWLAYRRRAVPALVAAAVGAGALVWYARTDEVAGEFSGMTPYITTLLVLAFASQRLRMPKADGLPYRRGEAR